MKKTIIAAIVAIALVNTYASAQNIFATLSRYTILNNEGLNSTPADIPKLKEYSIMNVKNAKDGVCYAILTFEDKPVSFTKTDKSSCK